MGLIHPSLVRKKNFLIEWNVLKDICVKRRATVLTIGAECWCLFTFGHNSNISLYCMWQSFELPNKKKTFRSHFSLFCIFRCCCCWDWDYASHLIHVQVISSNSFEWGRHRWKNCRLPTITFCALRAERNKTCSRPRQHIFMKRWRDGGDWLPSIDQIVMATDSRWTLNGVVTWNNNSIFIPSSTNWNRVQHVQSW